ncbi:MAG: hypothetical protein ACI8SE_001300 [Bacteroidia bacterium]|jgi:hypothetical protein
MFEPISLAEMDKVKLMKRMDTKFVVHADLLPELLKNISNDYKVLEIDSNRVMTYDSLYFDTSDLRFYLDHHNKISKRTKVRIRNYVESDIAFLEVKQKDSKKNTVKSRIPFDKNAQTLNTEGDDFVRQITGRNLELNQTLSNSFNRFTLVGKRHEERVTFDLNLAYNNLLYNGNLAIIELKQEKLNRNSSVFQELKKLSVHPYSISKYCIGMATSNPDLKQNFFKHKILTINKKTA